MTEIDACLETLQRASGGASLTREWLEAYCTLYAFDQHWPRRSNSRIRQVLAEWKPFIEAREFDRFVKQRRIALSRLAQNLS
jgi:hypothetical protein